MTRKNPEYYINRKKELNDRFYLVLNEMITLYPKYKSHPDFPEYSKNYIIDKGNMQKLQSDFFLLKNGLEKDITSLNKEIKQVNNNIGKIKKDNIKLSGKMQVLKNGGAAAHGMFLDSRLLYNQQVMSNWVIGGAIIGTGFLYYKNRG
jgi:hypothetical protein